MGTYWTVLQARTGWEAGVRKRLERIEVKFFQPAMEVERVTRGRRHLGTEAMFPGYIFLELGDDDPWHPAEQVYGAVRILKSNHKPVRIARAFIEDLDGALAGGVLRLPRAPRFLPRQIVRLIEGPWAGYCAEFSRMSGEDRCRVLLSMFGRATELDVDVGHLVAA